MKIGRVVLADDDNLVRAGIRALLENIRGVEVVGEAGDGQQALTLCHELKPDIVLLDINMPRLNGIEVAARVKKDLPQTQVVMLSMHTEAKYIYRALNAGATGYLPKYSSLPELEEALRSVRANKRYISPSIPEDVLAAYEENQDIHPNKLDLLTERQREILQLIAEGHTTQEIAHILAISDKTVETHRAHLMARLNIYDIAGLVKFAVRSGLVMLDDDA